MPQAAAPQTVCNQLLTALPPDALAEIMPKLRPCPLIVRETLIVPEHEVKSVYFVESGWVSLVATLEDGTQAEVGLVGREGMVGTSLTVGVDSAFEEAMVQANGRALRLEADAFRKLFDDIPPFRRILLRYSEAVRAQAMQTAACNGRHPLEQRLARWLLMAHDRAEGDDLPVTQEFLALMLCVYRPSITVVAGTLHRAGLIRYNRGHVEILDRDALEATSCDCYFAVKRRFNRLLGGS